MGKKLVAASAKVDSNKFYDLSAAIKLAQTTSYTKFDGAIDLAFNLNLDPRKAEQQLRGALVLPNGNGKQIRILVVTDREAEQEAVKKVGADIVITGAELPEIIKKGKFAFDIIVADPQMMPILGKFGKDLGPKGLMPNPKTGTVTPHLGAAVQEIKKGKANYRTDKEGNIHVSIGKVSFTSTQLVENAQAIIDLMKKMKPATVKGKYILNLTVSASMGPAIKIKIAS